MPMPKMSPEAQAAYDKALRRIEECRREGKAGTVLKLYGLGLTTLPWHFPNDSLLEVAMKEVVRG